MNIFNVKGKCITIMLCSSCNTKCKHCYISYSGNRTKNDVVDMIDNLQNQGYNVYLNGTEPLLFEGFVELFEKTGQQQIFSNGKIILEKPELLELLKKHKIKQVSYSYHYGIQNEWSEVKIKDVENAIKITKEAGLEVCILCSLCTKNYDKVLEICQKAYELGVNEIHFTNFILQGCAKINSMQNLVLSEEQILVALKDIDKARCIYNKNKLYISRCGSFGNIINSHNYICTAGREDYVITPDNKIYPCIFFAGIGEYQIGKYENGKVVINKKCNYDCNNCFAKNILNYNEKMNIIEPLE